MSNLTDFAPSATPLEVLTNPLADDSIRAALNYSFRRDILSKRVSVTSHPGQAMSRLLIALCVLLTCAAAHADVLAKRWAILASPAVRESGVSDLLFANLAQQELELVEREELDKLLQEIELSQLSGPHGTRLRLQLGPQLKADGLILLSLKQPSDQPQRLKLVICETTFGARLKVEYRPWPASAPKELSADLAKVLDETRQHYPDGIRKIIGVGPFLSLNLLHDFDHLQWGFSGLLARGLSAHPGVAVLEIEETRAIGRELQLSGGELRDRIVPVIFEGTFRMSEQAKAVTPSSARVSVSVSVAGEKGSQWTITNHSLSEASTWLAEQLPQLTLRLADDRPKSLTRQQQFEALVRRADMFSLVGSWLDASRLREAALLLEDDLAEQFRLIGDYRRGLKLTKTNHQKARTILSKQNPTQEESKSLRQQQVAIEASLIDLLIQRIERRLAARDVSVIEGAFLWQAALNSLGVTVDRDERRRRHELKTRVFWDNIPRLKRLDPLLRNGDIHPNLRQALDIHPHQFWQSSPGGQVSVWTNTAMGLVMSLASQNRYLGIPFEPAHVLRDIKRLLNECAPWPVPAMVLKTLPKGYSQFGGGELLRTLKIFKLPERDVPEFFGSLADSDDTLSQIYGRVGLLSEKLELHQGKPPHPPSDAVLGELHLLRALLLDYANQNPDLYDVAVVIDERLIHAEVIATRGWRSYTRWRSQQWDIAKPTEAELHEHDRWVRRNPASIRFEPIKGVAATWDRLVACGKNLDAVYRSDELWLMHEPGQLESIFRRPTETDHIQTAVWDGRWLWVTSDESGLRVFDRSGRQPGHLPPASDDASENTDSIHTLPPYRPGGYGPSHYRLMPQNGFVPMIHHMPLRIHPLGDGRCVVAGTSGQLKRLWICMVHLHPSGEWSVELIHQGLKIPTCGDDTYLRDANYAFEATWMAPFLLPGDTPRQAVLIGRHRALIDSKGLPPLVLDLDSRDVSVLPAHFSAENNRWSPVVTVNDQLFHKGRYVLETLQPNADGQWKLTVMDPSPQRYGNPMQGPLLRVGDGTFLVPDYSGWTRIHTQPWQIERLKHDRSQPRVNYQLSASSAHFGPVAWLPDQTLMRVVIEPPGEASNKR